MAARMPAFAAPRLHVLPKERGVPLPAGVCPVSQMRSRMGGECFPVHPGVVHKFSGASGWARLTGHLQPAGWEESPGPWGLTRY